ncbi:MAG: septation protein A [Gammaproteobacteria bacterium]|nr:septation protein A [Gammaproteobacteria bacterium]
MFNLLYDFLIIFLFFIAFKLYGIYVATTVGIVGTASQVIIHRLWKGCFDKKQLFVLSIFIVFGGMTLYFHNPIFVKWKPSIVFWIFGVAIIFSHFMTKQPIMQRLMGSVLEDKMLIPLHVWKKLNLAWALFFLLLGTINILIAYHFTTEVWVNFKLYGILGSLFLFAVGQSIYLSRYLEQK